MIALKGVFRRVQAARKRNTLHVLCVVLLRIPYLYSYKGRPFIGQAHGKTDRGKPCAPILSSASCVNAAAQRPTSLLQSPDISSICSDSPRLDVHGFGVFGPGPLYVNPVFYHLILVIFVLLSRALPSWGRGR